MTEAGQHLIAEPPDLSGLLGPTANRRHWAAWSPPTCPVRAASRGVPMRDHVMGVRAVTGRAEVIRSGGRVLKNVTGLDLCKLLTGSHGTLGVITEITLKVLPAPEATGTLVLPGLDAAAGVAASCPPRWARRSACLVPPGLPADTVVRVSRPCSVRGSATLIRIEDFSPSVTYRIGRLKDQFAVAVR